MNRDIETVKSKFREWAGSDNISKAEFREILRKCGLPVQNCDETLDISGVKDDCQLNWNELIDRIFQNVPLSVEKPIKDTGTSLGSTARTPKKILITGSGTGLGRAAALELALRGHTVYATTISKEQSEEMLSLQKPNLHSFPLDILDEASYEKLLPLELDVLVHNAGVGFTGSIAEIPMSVLRKNFEINFFAPIALTQFVLPGMIDRGSGRIVFVNSMAGRITFPFMGSYCSTKHAGQAVVEALHAEMKHLDRGIQATLIEPGPYDTGFNAAMIETKYKLMEDKPGGSFWSDEQIEDLKAKDRAMFAEGELTDLTEIVQRYVEACEDEVAAERYCAPESMFRTMLKPIEIDRHPKM